jgi:hypothetical protein
MEKKFKIIGIIAIILVSTISVVGFFIIYEDVSQEDVIEASDNKLHSWRHFTIGDHNFSSVAYGSVNNTYWLLNIGYRIVLEGDDEDEFVQVNITVLNETEIVGGITTRVVEERESIDGELAEVSRNYFALCNETNDIIYFGELSIDYAGGVEVGRSGTWRADEGASEPGIIMPGSIFPGDRYYQEYAPGAALDRAMNLRNDVRLQTPIGVFDYCLTTEESTPLEPLMVEYKTYALGIGIISDETLIITFKGYVSV